MTEVLVFLTGLILGSFLSVVFSRLELGEKPRRRRTKARSESIATGRSRCDHCGTQIPWYDNLPLVSFVVLRGKCRYCGKKISGYHPLLELSSGLLLLAAYLAFGFAPQFFLTSAFGLILLLLFAFDMRHQLIPNVIVAPAIAAALLVVLANFVLSFKEQPEIIGLLSGDPMSYVLGGLFYGGFFLALSLISRGAWIGGGDIKLGFLLGLLLGWPYVLLALVLAYVIGTVYAAVLLVAREASMKSMVPFAPMLVLSFLITAFYGDVIINWYEGLLV